MFQKQWPEGGKKRTEIFITMVTSVWAHNLITDAGCYGFRNMCSWLKMLQMASDYGEAKSHLTTKVPFTI